MSRASAILLMLAAARAAALEVIRDAGGEPIAPYLARLMPRDTGAMLPRRVPLARPDRVYSIKQHLPIRSPSLTPGPVEARQTPIRLIQPLFLVGADSASLQWLEANRERLQQLHAIGMLIQAETDTELEIVTTAAQGLPMIFTSGEAFAEQLGIRYYPVLITREGIGP